MQQKESHIVPVLDEPKRLSDYAGGIFRAIPSRKGMKKAMDKGLVLLNGKLASTADLVSGGECLELVLDDTEKQRPTIELELTVLYEDAHLAVINKPAGIEVSGNRKWTIENALLHNLKPSTEADATQAEAIHRLDYPTTGALLIGKTRTAIAALNSLFAQRQVAKIYAAVTIGKMTDAGTNETPVDGKPSQSDYLVLNSVVSERFSVLNLVQLTPKTGRRHQLRKHMAEIGHPILGDKDYGTEGLILNGKGLYLHSMSLSFVHPFTQQNLTVEAPLPKKFKKLFP